jgi:nodulation protein A
MKGSKNLNDVRFDVCWEGDLLPADHADIADTLREAFTNVPGAFPGAVSWAGARPELRVIARVPGGVAGHMALLRRFIRVDDTDLLVAQQGLHAVHPSMQGTGLGRELIVRTADVLRGLGVPFGYENVLPSLVPLHTSSGWRPIPNVVTRYIRNHRPFHSVTADYPALMLQGTSAVEQWPAGHVVSLNGQEL